ncbi:LuxE/PaaK family acyltransferase [Sphingobacterium cellulitidis]|uniref:Acyltransferase n=1 Tax=Sphingobacterium cellulitidis TaxID=1768011 RepID=A0A8H9G466_9SPHI|nr:acyl transferase [Sphingobacterium soli]MBA8986718.1 phenylacetate-coenzyme A ligase PaaK-like adenylate-forming protein [Sphingobacterium soli]GGE27046.1 acyltransferase [Sphingobacterium soli]
MEIANKIFNIQSEEEFNHCALEVFRFQAQNNKVYQQYIDILGINPKDINHYKNIPFLPIQFFKSQDIIVEGLIPEVTFSSSGTTGMITSKHLVAKSSLYIESFRKAFEEFYGDVKDIAILALLPSYLERSGSSLIYMVDDLINRSEKAESGYFLYNHEDLFNRLTKLRNSKTKTVLFGVTYALLDFIENFNIDFPELIVMETGGMKGKRKEMIREELHDILCKGFNVPSIHSEYGMTELLSQGYSSGNGLFKTPNWMKILIRDTNDPLTLLDNKKTGAINVIDLANYYSCSFIATQDLGKFHSDGSFEILGRFDNSDIRGCNLLVQ